MPKCIAAFPIYIILHLDISIRAKTDTIPENYTQFDFKELSRLLKEKDNETKKE